MNLKRITALVLLAGLLLTACSGNKDSIGGSAVSTADAASTANATSTKDTPSTSDTATTEATECQEENAEIYSYLQGIKSYEKGLDWTGSWSQIEAGGQLFSAFGCGICCLANVYSTMTGQAHDPEEMYQYALDNSSYNPDSGVGALSWDQLKSLLDSLGIDNQVLVKPATLEEFEDLMSDHTTLLVLVSSDNDQTLWTNVPGHYVNIWDYDSTDQTVFLTDSKGPTNNRTRVNIEDVYNSLKTSSTAQIAACSW